MSRAQEKLSVNIEALTDMNTVALRTEYRRVCKTDPPPLGHDLLRRAIAYKLQEKVHGGLTKGTLRDLSRMSAELERGSDISAGNAIKPGTRLVRQWRDKTYHVMVLESGYLFEDREYRSLSQIASQVTGAKWSGPRFFGLVPRTTSISGKAPVEILDARV